MTVKEISIDTRLLNRDAEQLGILLGRLEKDKTKMAQEIQELNRMWKGPSNQAFNAQFKTDLTSFDALSKTLREMIQAMKNAKTEYDQCDNRINGLVNALKI